MLSFPAVAKKNPHAQALGRLGGRKTGKANWERLTPEERAKRQRAAGIARWERMTPAQRQKLIDKMTAARKRAAAARKRTKRTPKK